MSKKINNLERELIEIKRMSNNNTTKDALTRKEIQQKSKLYKLQCNVNPDEQPR